MIASSKKKDYEESEKKEQREIERKRKKKRTTMRSIKYEKVCSVKVDCRLRTGKGVERKIKILSDTTDF